MMEMHPKLPQLAKPGDPESIPGAVMEPKLDGHRILAFVTADGVKLYARTGADKSGKLPMVEAELARLPVGTVLDGEVIYPTPDHAGGDWSKVQEILGAQGRTSTELQYAAFDCLSVMGEDVRLHPLHVRRSFLRTLLTGGFGNPEFEHVVVVPQFRYSAEQVQALIDDGWEGAIVKDPASTYASGKRGHGWVKVKATETVDVVVIGATEGKGRFEGQIGALVFGQYVRATNETVNGGDLYRLVEMGQCSGMDDNTRLMFTNCRPQLPGTVIEIQHMGRMPSGGLRHPQFKRVRTDKRPEECVA